MAEEKPDVDERRARALEMHLAGATYDAIARQLGFAQASGAYQAVRKALEAQQPPDQDPPTQLTEVARLDAMLVGLWPKARRGDVAAVDRVLRIEERRAQILDGAPVAAPEPKGQEEGSGVVEFTRRLRDRQSAAFPTDRA